MQTTPRALVLLAGFPDDASLWDGLVSALQSDYHPVVALPAPDLDKPALSHPWGHRLDACVRLVQADIERQLGVDVPYDLVAHDWGALFALNLAGNDKHRWRIRKLVLIDVGGSSKEHGIVSMSELLQFRGISIMWVYQVYFLYVFLIGKFLSERLANSMLRLWTRNAGFMGPCDKSFCWNTCASRPVIDMQWWMCYPYWQLWWNCLLSFRHPPKMPFPAMPTLFIFGARKRCYFHSTPFIDEMHRRVNSGYEVLEYECGHWPMIEMPSRVNRDIGAFLVDEGLQKSS